MLFEEMDGVWLHMQDKKHKKRKKQEMKVFTMYEGWDAGKKNRSTLVGKTMLAGMEKSREFHEKREALIRKKYNADEIEQRILNGDGGSWIKEPYDPDVIFQLDRYHIYQEILRKLSDKRAQNEARELFESEKIKELLEFIRIYADSVDSADEKDTGAERRNRIPGNGCARVTELYRDNDADETPADEVVRVRSKSSCESALPEREPGIN